MTRAEMLSSLSIVLQGPLLADDAAALAGRCRHWRATFPGCPLILSISGSDLAGDTVPPAIRAECDRIVFAFPAAPLPPVKDGLGANNVNLQISAAQAGLAAVTTEWVLRVRNDLMFTDASIADYYAIYHRLPRGRAAVLADRVLISPWFTLDPLTMERLPFHYSDWFHLGRTRDVAGLWDVPPMSGEDAIWYARHALARRSNHRETGFRSRLAAEQHIVVAALARLGRPVTLRHHNDRHDAARSLQVLADDFMIADFRMTPLTFDKYAHLLTAHDIDLVCVTAADWRALVAARGWVPSERLFADKHRRANALLCQERADRAAPRWRFWPISRR